MRTRAPRWLSRIALVAGLVGVAVAMPLAASADEAECDGSYLSPEGSGGSREFFRPDPSVLPPALRAFEADCASRVVGELVDDVLFDGVYNLVYVDFGYADFVRVLRALESEGWVYDGTNRNIDLGSGEGPQHLGYSIDRLEELDPQPWLVQSQFTRPEAGDILTMQWSDGEHSGLFDGWTEPHLVIDVLLTAPFATTGLGDPSVLSSLRTIAEATPNPTQTGVLCTAAVVLMLVVGYPGSLLNTVVGARYDRFLAWWRRVNSGRRRDRPAEPPSRRTSWLVWPGFAAAAVIGAFVDPAFGVNAMSGRLLLTAFLGFLVINLAGWALVRAIMTRAQSGAGSHIRFRWGSLVVVAFSVLIARALELQPGVIFGLVAGLAFGATLALSRDALVILLGSGFALAVALVAWVGYSIVAPLADGAPGNVPLVFTSEFFSGLTIEGVSTLPLALLPLAALDGAKLLRWRKWVWALAYVIGLAAFMLVLFTIPDSFGRVSGDFVRWALLFAGFAVVAIGAWVIHTIFERRSARRIARSAAGAAAGGS